MYVFTKCCAENQYDSVFSKNGEMFSLIRDQIVLGLPPSEADLEIIVRTGKKDSRKIYRFTFIWFISIFNTIIIDRLSKK